MPPVHPSVERHPFDGRVNIGTLTRCKKCGALVQYADQTLHAEFHRFLESLSR